MECEVRRWSFSPILTRSKWPSSWRVMLNDEDGFRLAINAVVEAEWDLLLLGLVLTRVANRRAEVAVCCSLWSGSMSGNKATRSNSFGRQTEAFAPVVLRLILPVSEWHIVARPV